MWGTPGPIQGMRIPTRLGPYFVTGEGTFRGLLITPKETAPIPLAALMVTSRATDGTRMVAHVPPFALGRLPRRNGRADAGGIPLRKLAPLSLMLNSHPRRDAQLRLLPLNPLPFTCEWR